MKAILSKVNFGLLKSQTNRINPGLILKNFSIMSDIDYSSYSEDETHTSIKKEIIKLYNLHDNDIAEKIKLKEGFSSDEENPREPEINIWNSFKDIKSMSVNKKFYNIKDLIMEHSLDINKFLTMFNITFEKSQLDTLTVGILPDYQENNIYFIKNFDEFRDFLLLSYFYKIIKIENVNFEATLSIFFRNFIYNLDKSDIRMTLKDIAFILILNNELNSNLLGKCIINCTTILFKNPLSIETLNELGSKYDDFKDFFTNFRFDLIMKWLNVNYSNVINEVHFKRISENLIKTIINVEDLNKVLCIRIMDSLKYCRLSNIDKSILNKLLLKIGNFLSEKPDSHLLITYIKIFVLIDKLGEISKECSIEILNIIGKLDLKKIYEKVQSDAIIIKLISLLSRVITNDKMLFDDKIFESILNIFYQVQDITLGDKLLYNNPNIITNFRVCGRVIKLLKQSKDDERKLHVNTTDIDFKENDLESLLRILSQMKKLLTALELNQIYKIVLTKLTGLSNEDLVNNLSRIVTQFKDPNFQKVISCLKNTFLNHIYNNKIQNLDKVVNVTYFMFSNNLFDNKLVEDNECKLFEDKELDENSNKTKASTLRFNLEEHIQIVMVKHLLNLHVGYLDKNLREDNRFNDSIDIKCKTISNIILLSNFTFEFTNYLDMIDNRMIQSFHYPVDSNLKNINSIIRSFFNLICKCLNLENSHKLVFIVLKFFAKLILVSLRRDKSSLNKKKIKMILDNFFLIYISNKTIFDEIDNLYPKRFYTKLLIRKRFELERSFTSDGPVKIEYRQMKQIRNTSSISDNYFI